MSGAGSAPMLKWGGGAGSRALQVPLWDLPKTDDFQGHRTIARVAFPAGSAPVRLKIVGSGVINSCDAKLRLYFVMSGGGSCIESSCWVAFWF